MPELIDRNDFDDDSETENVCFSRPVGHIEGYVRAEIQAGLIPHRHYLGFLTLTCNRRCLMRNDNQGFVCRRQTIHSSMGYTLSSSGAVIRPASRSTVHKSMGDTFRTCTFKRLE